MFPYTFNSSSYFLSPNNTTNGRRTRCQSLNQEWHQNRRPHSNTLLDTYQSRHRPSTTQVWYLLFFSCVISWVGCSYPFLYQQGLQFCLVYEFKLIELYNYSSHLTSFYFFLCIKSWFSLCIIFRLHPFILLINYPRLYLSLSCFSYLPIPPRHRHITRSSNDLWRFLVTSNFSSSTRANTHWPTISLLHKKKENHTNSIYSPVLDYPHSFSFGTFVYIRVFSSVT